MTTPLPITRGDLRDFPEDPVVCMRELHDKHGPIAQLEAADGQRITFVFHPEHNRTVLSDGKRFHSQFFAVRGSRRSAQRRVTSGLLTMNGKDHKRHRRMVMEPFSRRVLPAYADTLRDLSVDLLDGWKPGRTLDLHEEMNAFMRRLTSAILFGLEDPALAYSTGEKIDRWVHLNHETGMGAFVSDARYLDRYDELLCLADELERDIQAMIDARRGRPAGRDVLSILIEATEHDADSDKNGGGISDMELIGHVTLLFGAAHLTTAHSLTWTLFLLAQHPEVARALVREVNAGVPGDFATPEEAASLPYTDRVIKESMRCLPASGYSQRVAAEPLELGPFSLPRGAAVIFSQFITHHLPEYYEDAYRFQPERWESLNPPPYSYIPFGGGPRMCLGAMLAMQILGSVVPSALKRFRLAVEPGAHIDGKIVSTMLGPITPLPVTLHPPDNRWAAAPVTGNVCDMVDLREMPRELRRAA